MWQPQAPNSCQFLTDRRPLDNVRQRRSPYKAERAVSQYPSNQLESAVLLKTCNILSCCGCHGLLTGKLFVIIARYHKGMGGAVCVAAGHKGSLQLWMDAGSVNGSQS